MDTPPERLPVRYFDGRSSRGQAAEAWLDGGQLHLLGPTVQLSVAAKRVRWPERTQRGPRVAQLPDGGSLQSADAAAWDRWLREGGRGDSAVVRLQQSWRAVFVSLALLVLLTVAGYVWGLPWVSREVADRVPDSVEAKVGEVVLAQLEGFTQPSQLPEPEQRAIEQAWDKVLSAHRAAEAARGVVVRPTRLLIRHSEDIGPNALALPGGAMLLTDDMVRLLQHDTRVIAGVLGHELGHVQHRHGMRMLVQVSVMGAASSLLWGDFSGILATVPLWLGQAHYSREAERESDAYSVEVLRASGIPPAVMVTLFERLALYEQCGDEVLKEPAPGAQPSVPQAAASCKAPAPSVKGDEKEGRWGLGFASHPANEERIAFFRAAAR
jgi:Zn-dependent protease with chaperone function